MLSFFCSDWKFMLQVLVLLSIFAVIRSAQEIWFPPEGFEAASTLEMLKLNLLGMLSLLAPAYLFILAGNCLMRNAGQILKRILALTFFGTYVVFTLFDVSLSQQEKFVWSVDSVFQTTHFYAAAATAVLFFAGFIVCSRFISQTHRLLSGAFRLALVLSVGIGLTLFDAILTPNRLLDRSIPLETIRMIVLLSDTSFTDVNEFLTKESDEKFLNSLRAFRPVTMPQSPLSSQLATLFSGDEPFQHGLRREEPNAMFWRLFSEERTARMIQAQTQADFHFTNITSPSIFSEFASGTGQSLCPPLHSATANATYEYLRKSRSGLIPFIPEGLLLQFMDLASCIPLKTPIDDLIHREMLTGLTQLNRKSRNLISIWNFDLSRIDTPLSKEEPLAGDQTLQVRRNLSMLTRAIEENLDNLKILTQAEVHFVALPSTSETMGAYFFVDPDYTRQSAWPLENENMAIRLSSLSKLFEPNDVRTLYSPGGELSIKSETLYWEEDPHITVDQSVGAAEFAYSLARSVSCSSFAESDRITTQTIRIWGLGEPAALVTQEDPEFYSTPFRSENECRAALIAELSRSIENDVHLFEPMSEPIEQLAELEDLTSGVKE